MRTLLIIILLKILAFPLYSNVYSDSLELQLESASISKKLELLNHLSFHYRKENTSKAIHYGEQYLKLAKDFGDKHEEIKALNNLGIVFYHMGFYETTLDYFIKVLEVAEALNEHNEIAKVLNNLGNLFDEIGDKERAIEYYQRALIIKQDSDDKKSLANTLNNLGFVHYELGNTAEADKYFRQALALDESEENVYGLFVTLNNLGLCNLKKGKLDSALYYIQAAFSNSLLIDNVYDKASMHNNLALVYFRRGEINKAIDNYTEALQIAQSLKARSVIKDAFKGLADIHSGLKNYSIALDYYKKYSELNDSIFSESNSRRIANIESDYNVQKREKEIQLLKKEAEIQSLILIKNRQVSYFLAAGLSLFIFLVIVFFQKYKFKVKANRLLKVQNEVIAAKNMDITDSIIYARGIQEAILPDDKIINNFFSDYFIYCKPRDIVNGDFYWFADKGDYFVMAVVDCTGHGVPGAFMNVIGHSLLNQIVIENEEKNPSSIINKLHKGILNTLHQDSLGRENKDGMDVGVILYEKATQRLTFAGAKHDLLIFQDSQMKVIKGNNFSIGGNYYQSERIFQDQHLNLSKGDTFYLYTDGIIDQFGEKADKKWMSRRFKEEVRKLQAYEMPVQIEIFEKSLKEWRGNLDQTDDILFIGVRV